jgi:hypothetical protein
MVKIFAALFVLVGGLAAFSSAQAAGGCGWGAHRGPYGGCRANGAVEHAPVVVAPAVVAPAVVAPGSVVYAPVGRACPYHYHLGPQGRRCLPN